MYTPFDLLYKELERDISDINIYDNAGGILSVLERIVLTKYDLSMRIDNPSLEKRREIINEFLSIENIYHYLRENSEFTRVNLSYIDEEDSLFIMLNRYIEYLQDKGFNYLYQVWNLNPK